MFIYNVSLNKNKIFKISLIFFALLIVSIVSITSFRIFNCSEAISKSNVQKISTSNYTNVLKAVHDNIDSYVGTKLNFSGYVYRLTDFKENQFVLARNMVISSDFQTVVVGFLCEYNKAKEFSDNSWVEITGEIIKGDYHGDMPIIKITEIKNTNKPNDELVYPPDDSYIPTSDIL